MNNLNFNVEGLINKPNERFSVFNGSFCIHPIDTKENGSLASIREKGTSQVLDFNPDGALVTNAIVVMELVMINLMREIF